MIHKLTATRKIGEAKGDWQEVDISNSLKDVIVGTSEVKATVKPANFVTRSAGVQKAYKVTTDDSTEDGLDAELISTSKYNSAYTGEKGSFKYLYPRFYMLVTDLTPDRLVEADSILPFAEEY